MNKFRLMLLGSAAAGVAAAGASPALAAGGPINSGNDKIKVTISGQITSTAAIVDDGGDNTRVVFGDNNFSGSKFRIIGIAKGSENLTVGARFELETQQNDSGQGLGEDNTPLASEGASFDQRWHDVWFQHKTLGKLSLGRGDGAANGTSEADLSGTIMAWSNSDPASHSANLKLANDTTNVVTATTLASIVGGDIDGLSRQQRIRYDTPTFQGARLAASFDQGERPEVAGFYSADIMGAKVVGRAGAAFSNSVGDRSPTSGAGTSTLGSTNGGGEEYRFTGSLAVLLPMGINVAGNYAHVEPDTVFAVPGTAPAGATGSTGIDRYGVKVGWRGKVNMVGKTGIAFAFSQTDDAFVDGSEAQAFAIAALLDLDAWSTQLYASWNYYDLDDSSATDFANPQIFLVGTIVKF